MQSKTLPKLRAFNLQKVITKQSIGTYRRKSSRPRDRIYASELGSCARAVWHNWRHPRPHDERFERGRGMLGHAAEWAMKHHLRPILLGQEVTFTNTRVSGRADFFVRVGKHQVPLEVKSTYAMGLSLDKPKPSHILQAAYYAMADDAPFALLVYFNLANYGGNSGEWVALRIPRLDSTIEARTNYLWRLVHSEVEPDCEHADDKGGCWDCSLVDEARP